MKIPEIRTWCCLDLKKAILVIGFVGSLLEFANVIGTPIAGNEVCGAFKHPSKDRDCWEATVKMRISICGSIIGMILEALMVFGSQKKKYRVMLVVVICKSIAMALAYMGFWVLIVKTFDNSVGMGVFWLFFLHGVAAFFGYTWLAIYGRMQEIKHLGPQFSLTGRLA